ncbi:MAG: hypothetical protein J0H98_07205 [Solirubrobacterales bacterium]|nr:hypothetical protein [Solirubrobacterales bacterium]
MGLTHRASLSFAGCRRVAARPVVYEPLDDNNTTWKRFERTMKGETRFPGGPPFVPWDEATPRQRCFANLLDRVLDHRPFLEVDLFDDIHRRLRANDMEPPETTGVLVLVVTPEPWQRDGIASRECSIGWLDSGEIESQQDIEVTVNTTLEEMSFHKPILEIKTFLFNTEEGDFTELAYEIPIPGELAAMAT